MVVWGDCSPEAVLNIHKRIRIVASATIDRLRAEFAGLRLAWSILRLQRIEDVMRTQDHAKQASYRLDLKRLAQAFELDFDLRALNFMSGRRWPYAISQLVARIV